MEPGVWIPLVLMVLVIVIFVLAAFQGMYILSIISNFFIAFFGAVVCL